MNIGFIGAGRVGFTLGKYLNCKGIYSSNKNDSIEASRFINCEYYTKLSDLVNECDTLFLTVNDDSISNVVKELINLNVNNKILIHTSGSYSSEIFDELNSNNYCYSVHPIYAFNDKLNDYKNMDNIYFTIEGNNTKLDIVKSLFKNNTIISKDNKTKYHSYCVMLSNLVCALVYNSLEGFKSIGINDPNIVMPLFINNSNNIIKNPYHSLTGPIIRNDINTIKKHLESLSGSDIDIYRVLSKKAVELANSITNIDYKDILEVLNNEKNN